MANGNGNYAGINPWPADFSQPAPVPTPTFSPLTTPGSSSYNPNYAPIIAPSDYGQTYYPTSNALNGDAGGTGAAVPGTTHAPIQAATGTISMGPRTPEANWNTLYRIGQAESGFRNVETSILDPKTGKPASTASGYWQIIDSTWKEGQDLAGIPPDQQTARAMQAPYAQQKAVAQALLQNRGTTPWASSQDKWGQGGQYASLDAPDEKTFDPSLGQIAALGGQKGGSPVGADQSQNGLRMALDQYSDYYAQQQQNAAMQQRMQNMLKLAAIRNVAMHPVSYDPYKVYKVGQTYHVDPAYVTGLPHMTEAQPLRPISQGVMATSPQMVTGRLHRVGPPGTEGGSEGAPAS